MREIPSVLLTVFLTIVVVAIMVPNSFAGERERHTLQTLLASRLPDRAILFGKIAVALVFVWGMTLIALLLSLVSVNVAHWDGQLLLYTPPIALGNLALSFLVATFMAGAGVLISQRAATVQEAAQKLLLFIFVPAIVVQMAPLLFRDQINLWIKEVEVNGAQLLAIVVAVWAVIDAGLLVAAIARFQRARLILD